MSAVGRPPLGLSWCVRHRCFAKTKADWIRSARAESPFSCSWPKLRRAVFRISAPLSCAMVYTSAGRVSSKASCSFPKSSIFEQVAIVSFGVSQLCSGWSEDGQGTYILLAVGQEDSSSFRRLEDWTSFWETKVALCLSPTSSSSSLRLVPCSVTGIGLITVHDPIIIIWRHVSE